MKTIENVTIYKCDFCPKELKRKHAMVRHEKYCFRNPINDRPCFSCEFLEYKQGESFEVHFVAGGDFDTRFEKGPNYWFCTKLNKKVYSIEAEKRNLIVKYPETFEDQKPMPKKCKYKHEFE